MERNQMASNFQKKPPNNFIKYSGIAFQMIAIILSGVYAGIWLDEKIPLTFPLFKLVLSLFSVGLSMYIVIKQVSNEG